MKKTTLITLLLLLLFVQSKAQTVTGRIVDSEKQSVVMATIALQTLDSINICATTADADGRFVLTADSIPLPFRLIVSSIGYETVMPECASYAVGDVVLATKTNVLGDVVVKSKRPILNVQGDRIVADASSIIKSRIVTCAFDVAKYVPGILCKNDNELSLAGTMSTTVLVNGKVWNGGSVLEYLKTLPAEKVSKVELLYNASPDMHVTGAVINVVLKDNKGRELTGQVKSSYYNNYHNTFQESGSLFYTTPKWSLYSMYTFADAKSISRSQYLSHHTVGDQVYDIDVDARTHSSSLTHTLYTNATYNVSDKSNVSLSYNASFSPKSDTRGRTTNSYFSNSNYTTSGNSYMHNLHLAYVLKQLRLDANYMSYSNDGTQDMNYEKYENPTAYSYWRKQTSDRFNFSADWGFALWKTARFSLGATYAYSKTGNRQKNADILNGGAGSFDISSSNDEHTANGYAGLSGTLFKQKLSYYFHMIGQYYKINDYECGAVLPTASLAYVFTPKHIMMLQYSKSRQFPSYWEKQEYEQRSDEYTVSIGNPDLRPMDYNILQGIYVFNNRYTLTVSYYRVGNFITGQTYQNPDRLEMVSKNFNIDYTSSLQLTATVPVSIGKWYNANYVLTCYKDRYKSSDWYGYSFDRSKWATMLNLSNTFTFSRKPMVALDVNAFFRTPTIVGLWNYSRQWNLDAGLKCQFLKDHAVVALNVSDIFESGMPLLKEKFHTQRQTTDVRFYRRSIFLSFTYKFRNFKEQNARSVDTSRLGY